MPLNGTKDADLVNFFQYQIVSKNGKANCKNSWVTDIHVDKNNVVTLVRGGRARWKIENETFNTLKNQGYHIEHNFGHGQQNLSMIFFVLNLLAFYVHQILQLTDWLYQTVRYKKFTSLKEYWNHSIHEKQVAILIYQIYFLEQLFPVFSQLLEFRQNILTKLKLADEAMEKMIILNHANDGNNIAKEIQLCQDELESRKKILDKFGREVIKILDQRFEMIKAKSGTFEFPKSRLRKSRLENRKGKIIKKYRQIYGTHHIKIFALFEHWRKKVEVRLLFINALISCEEKKTLLHQKISDIIPELERIAKPIQATINGIENNTLNQEVIREKYLTRALIFENLPDLHNIILDRDLHEPFDSFLSDINIHISELDGQCLLPLKGHIDKLKRPGHLKKIDIKNIVTGKSTEYLDNSIISERLQFTRSVQKIHNNIDEILQVIEYSLEYYLTENNPEKSDISEFLNGIKRAYRKSEDSIMMFHHLKDTTPLKLIEITEIFIRELLDSLVFEHLYKSERKALRKKFYQDNKLVLFRAFKTALRYSKQSILKTREAILILRTRYLNLRIILGITTDKKSISSELSNYLAETQAAISQLPLMYQRLFKIEPLTNQRFLIQRTGMIDQLNNALENWKKGKYAPVCLVGEPGSGITTLINVFTDSLGKEIDIYRFNLETRIITEGDYLNYMKKVFADMEFNNLDELYIALNKESF